MRRVAGGLHAASRGYITPNGVTWFGFLMHVSIAYLIATGHPWRAAAFLAVFGLFDTLDGELARLQGRVSDFGGLLDATTDRLKEVLLYSGVAYFFVTYGTLDWRKYAAIAVAACGASICVSFVKSKGETLIAAQKKKLSYSELNHLFGGGLFPFEVRMVVLLAGLIFGYLPQAVTIIAVGATLTVFQRLYRISKVV
ncbi:MAG: CDP-diacylglycerol---glycerol-3-phosphate 3-phosphatidyltransferase [Patescibacteria group bacterium]|nr:CDP-diacylglycerol---glycerol-3-phosphate 3-phosphatidyltransferase [Patescibacteria group bacterium]